MGFRVLFLAGYNLYPKFKEMLNFMNFYSTRVKFDRRDPQSLYPLNRLHFEWELISVMQL